MSATHDATQRYRLSFTSGALLAREAQIAAPLYLESRDWNLVREGRLRAENLLQADSSSSLRLSREVVQRLAVLSDDGAGVAPGRRAEYERGHLMWVAACRRYAIVGDFAEEVVRERFLLLTPTLSYDDFDSFVRGKSLWHPGAH